MLNNVEQTEVQSEKAYTFRKLGAMDIAPMCKVISKIGINEFAKCFDSQAIVDLVKSKGDVKNLPDLAGVQVMLDVVNTIVTHLPDAEKDIFNLLASVSGLKVEVIRAFDLATFTNMVIDFVKKEEFKDFIGVVSKLFK